MRNRKKRVDENLKLGKSNPIPPSPRRKLHYFDNEKWTVGIVKWETEKQREQSGISQTNTKGWRNWQNVWEWFG